jgi:ankyrin repeat protein
LKETGLHIAAKRNNIDVLILLLEYKSDYEFKDLLGRTPLHIAIVYNNFDSI